MKLSEDVKFIVKLFGLSLCLSGWLYWMFPPQVAQAQPLPNTSEARMVKALEDIASELREIRMSKCK